MVGMIDIQDYIEHEDGSATITFDCDVKTRELLTGLGLVSLLEKAVNKEDGYDVADPNQLEFDFDDRS
tara:strand:+ start:58 stop:261 length:204 start_codon:yes stop_codon:yes gene_type:complete